MPNTKPYVAVACLCERVLTEQDNVASLIRIVDTYTLQVPTELPLTGLRPALSLTIFVSVKSGDVIGQHQIGIVLRRPNGKSEAAQKWPVVLAGEPQGGVNLKLDFGLVGEPGALPDVGLYWFDVLWDEGVLTSIPLMLKRAEPNAPASPTAH